MSNSRVHETVLLQQSVDALAVESDGIYIDCTFGGGGHSRLILSSLGPHGRLFAMDQDPEAISIAREMAAGDSRIVVEHGNFSGLEHMAHKYGIFGDVSGVLFDLGVSSPQLDVASRGFSFMRDGPLDMRMDPGSGQSAADWISTAAEAKIADVLKHYGEEKFARRMARAIVKARLVEPITTTGQLAEIVKQANPAWERGKHPATRAFQAIRIFINDELSALSSGLDQSLEILRVGGRLAVISFHSLEDKIVKKFISLQTKGDNFPRAVPVRQSDLNPRLKSVGKLIRVTDAEIRQNPRSRSAILRIAEKIA